MTDLPTPIPTPGSLLRKYGLSPRKSWGQNFLHDVRVHEEIVAERRDRRASRGGDRGRAQDPHDASAGVRCRGLGHRAGPGSLRGPARGAAAWTGFNCLRRTPSPTITRRRSRGGAGGRGGEPALSDHGRAALRPARSDEVTDTWVVMVQQEVADRLCASPGNKQYGAPTVSLGRTRRMERVCHVGPGSFLPPPRVQSTVVALHPLPSPRGEVGDPAGFRALVRAAFGQRRKTLLNSLSVLADKSQVRDWCDAAGVSSSERPERLEPEAFAALQRARESADHA